MKTALLIFLGGVFLAIVLSDTTSKVCQDYEVALVCGPCDQTCGEPQKLCKVNCTTGATFCRCKVNHSRISETNGMCVPNESCHLYAEKNCTTKTTD